ncbi:MAG: isocitrate lyase/PEP mutase family protein [Burkholderiaceae bacterium]
MPLSNQQAVKRFRDLHADGVLILANAWDAGSARVIENAGAKALATTSAGLAWSCGYPDGDALPADVLGSAIASIARVIQVPLTADVEGGYSSDPVQVAELVLRVIHAGAVGINIEDGSSSVDLLCAKIEKIRAHVQQAGVDVFINVRTDVYLRGLVDKENRLSETLRRAAAYQNAGADGIFVPGLAEQNDISQLCAQISLPINLMAVPGLPTLAELKSLGVKRLSAGSAIAQAMFGQTQRMADAFLKSGDVAKLFTSNSGDYKSLNSLF